MRHFDRLVLGLVAVVPIDALAASPEIPWAFIGRHALNLTILLTILTVLLRKPISNAVKARAGNIRSAIDEAQALRKDAEIRYEELEGRLARFEGEMQKLKAEAISHAETERDAILAQAQREAQSIREGAERTIRDETARARRSLQEEAVRLAVQLAEEKLRNQVGDADNERFTREVLEAMNTGGRD